MRKLSWSGRSLLLTAANLQMLILIQFSNSLIRLVLFLRFGAKTWEGLEMAFGSQKQRNAARCHLLTQAILFATTLFLMLPLAATGNGAPCAKANEELSMITLKSMHDGNTIEVRVDDTILVQLRENPTTGYQWDIEEPKSRLIRLLGTDYIQSETSGVGGGGERALTFKAKEAGRAILKLKLWREWEGDNSVIDRFEVTLVVRD